MSDIQQVIDPGHEGVGESLAPPADTDFLQSLEAVLAGKQPNIILCQRDGGSPEDSALRDSVIERLSARFGLDIDQALTGSTQQGILDVEPWIKYQLNLDDPEVTSQTECIVRSFFGCAEYENVPVEIREVEFGSTVFYPDGSTQDRTMRILSAQVYEA